MLILRDPADATCIPDPNIRRLVELRFTQVCAGEPYDYDEHGYMIVAEPGDSVNALEREGGCAILHDPFADVPYGHPDFTPSFDFLLEHNHDDHGAIYEMHFDTSDDGIGITLFIPAEEGIPANLLSLCRAYAQQASEVDEV